MVKLYYVEGNWDCLNMSSAIATNSMKMFDLFIVGKPTYVSFLWHVGKIENKIHNIDFKLLKTFDSYTRDYETHIL